MSDIHVTGLIGKAIADSGIENYMETMAVKWDESKSSSKWWQLWKKVSFIAITNFYI